MGMKEMIAKQYDYGCWVRDKLLREARQLSDAEYFAEPEFGGLRSVHATLLHTLATDWVWRNVANNGRLPGPPPSPEDYATLADIEAGWKEEEAAFRTLLDDLDEHDLEAEVDTMSPAGQAYTMIRWQMLQHMLLHAMQHRTEVAAVLSGHGRSPGDLDFLFFMIGRE